ncbi:MAG: hypothetical protein MJZ25_03530 [Fibrobacter sp.]|nr:hypothetical protein [Fibrobacter sp.]
MIIKTKVLTTTNKQNLTNGQAKNARDNIKAQGKLITENNSNVSLTDKYDDDGNYLGQLIVATGSGGGTGVGVDLKIDADGHVAVDTTGTNPGVNSFVTGTLTKTTGKNAVAMGESTYASAKSQLVFGEFNIKDSDSGAQRGTYVEIVGNGTDDENRSNIRTLDWDGNQTIAGDLYFAYNEDESPVSLRTLIKTLNSVTSFIRVETLPDVGVKNAIYLVRDPDVTTGDVYTEWVYVKTEESSEEEPEFEWIQIGDTTIDTTGFFKTEDIQGTFTPSSNNPPSCAAIAAVLTNFMQQYSTMPETASAGTIVEYIGETTDDYTLGHFYRYGDDGWAEIELGRIYTEGEGVSIGTDNSINIALTEDSVLSFTTDNELDDSVLKPWIGTKAELDALSAEEIVKYKMYCTTDE